LGIDVMLSVVIATHEDEGGLLPTLAALVPGAAAGIVREVIVVANAHETTAQIADIAGCRLINAQASRGARLKLAAATARARWLLFLQPGLVPEVSWIDETRRFIEQAELDGRAGAAAAAFRPRSARSLGAEAIELLRLALGRRPHQGLLIAKALYDDVAGHRADVGSPERDLVHRLGRRRIVLLRCGAGVPGHRYS
jgi:hypothetical protein